MGAPRLLLAACVFLALVPALGGAQRVQVPAVEHEEIKIDAEEISYDRKTDQVVARGKVVITRGDTELRADEVRVNRTTNEAEARGNVSLTDAEGSVWADEMRLNLEEETGWLTGAAIQSRRYRYSLWGERVEKGVGQSYHIENGRFTTCQCERGAPSWSISGKDLHVTLGGYGTLKGGTFNILDVPVVYVPRALFPVQRERQSGFLVPRFGASNRRGFQTLLPFYWAIDKSQDATLALDVETSARAGAVGEYRYALSRGSGGVISGSYFNESFRGAATSGASLQPIPKDRWSVVGEQRQKMLDDLDAYSELFLVSDDRFLREINTYAFEHSRNVAIRTLPFTESRVGMLQLWDRVGVKGEATYYQDLTPISATTPQFVPQRLQRVPEVSLWGQTLLGEPVMGGVAADAVLFQREAVDFQRLDSADGFRLDVEPGVAMPLPLGQLAFGGLRASVRETAYRLTDTELAGSNPPRQLPQERFRQIVQLGGEIGTVLDRVYAVDWFGLQKVKHTIEPGVEYLYIPAVGQGDLPLFDGTDRVNQRNLITYGVVSRVIGKSAEAPAADDGAESERVAVPSVSSNTIRELGRLSLTQSADIRREIDPLQSGRAADHFSDIDFAGRVNPSRMLSMRFATNYDTTSNNISAAKVGFFIEDPRNLGARRDTQRLETRTSAGVSYRFLTQNLLQEVDSNIVVRLTDWAGFLYSSRYDVVTNDFLDNFFGLRFISACDCWALDIAVTDRRNPQEVEARAQLTLVGLGSSKSDSRVAAVP